jgi:hypothetical protein
MTAMRSFARDAEPKGRARQTTGNWAVLDGYLDDIAKTDGGERRAEGVDFSNIKPIDCPCCKRPVSVPSLEIVIDRYGVTPLQARILEAVWRGKGMPVVTERIFDAMYADDPDGGPTPSQMYKAFKVALCRLRERLEGTGIGIENVGYRQGYRLVIGEN